MALSCLSFVTSVCALTDFSCLVSDMKLVKLMTVCVIGSIRNLYTYINVNSHHWSHIEPQIYVSEVPVYNGRVH